MKAIRGDLIKLAKSGVFDVIIHGCNCFHTMGAGIALRIKENFPQAYFEDLKTKYGDNNKLGTYTFIRINNNGKDLFIINAYTQFHYSWQNKSIRYDALRKCLKKIKTDFSGLRFGLPKIGCGLAGGSWDIVSKIIEEELNLEDVTIVYFEKER
jgi:O-acetyl-ADP-ribose deacetylase (regulator of RNase III)